MYLNKKILAVVPARGGSKGVKLKNIRCVKGIPLVGHAGNLCKELTWLDRAIVSTDHDEIAKVAQDYGLDVPFMRPTDISGDQIADWDVLNHALHTIEALDKTIYDVIVMLQPTSPNRTAQHVTDTVHKLIVEGFDAVWTLSETDKKFHPLKQLHLSEAGEMDYYDPDGASIIARQQLQSTYHRNGIAYAITRDCLVRQKSIKGQRSGAVIIHNVVINIDTEQDLALANAI